MAVGVDRGAGDAAHFKDLAAIGQMLGEPVRPQDAEALLIDIDIDRILRVEDVVEGDEDDAGFLGALDTGSEGGWILGVDDDRVIARVDEVVDRRDLCRHVLAGRDDLEFLQLGGDIGLRRIGLGGLDHLDAPGIGDIAIGQRDPVGTFFLRIFVEFRLCRPRHEAVLHRSSDLRRPPGLRPRRCHRKCPRRTGPRLKLGMHV